MARIGEGRLQRRKRRPHAAHEMGDDAGHQRGEDHRVIDPAQIEHFNAEKGSRNRRAEYRGEASANPTNHQPPPVLVAKAQDIGEQAGQGGADLRGRSLLADRSAKRQRHNRCAQLDGRDEPVDATGSLVHGGDDRFRTVAPGIGREGANDPDAEGKRDRQKDEDRDATGRERTCPVSGARESPEKDARAKADADPSNRAEHRPFERADKQCRMLGVPASLVGETRGLVPEDPAAEPQQPRSKTGGHRLCPAYPKRRSHAPDNMPCAKDRCSERRLVLHGIASREGATTGGPHRAEQLFWFGAVMVGTTCLALLSPRGMGGHMAIEPEALPAFPAMDPGPSPHVPGRDGVCHGRHRPLASNRAGHATRDLFCSSIWPATRAMPSSGAIFEPVGLLMRGGDDLVPLDGEGPKGIRATGQPVTV